MRKFLLVIIGLAAILKAGATDFSYGLQWGYCPQVASYEHCNFRSDVGPRIEEKNLALVWNNNMNVNLFAEYFVKGWLSAGISAGVEGYTDDSITFPICLRIRVLPFKNGIFGLTEGGYARTSTGTNVVPLRLYLGYRKDLGKGIFLDIMAGGKINLDYAQYYDDKTYGRIPAERIVFKQCFNACLGINLALSF